MEFEYDPVKSLADLAKHGIDFEMAQSLWSDPFLIEAPALIEDEPRLLAIGRIGAQHWTAVFTWREEPAQDHLGAKRPTEGDRAL